MSGTSAMVTAGYSHSGVNVSSTATPTVFGTNNVPASPATPIQHRLMLKTHAIDTWSLREQLGLASAVLRSGDQNWVSVSRQMKPFAEEGRPNDWFSQKNCALQYKLLLEKVYYHVIVSTLTTWISVIVPVLNSFQYLNLIIAVKRYRILLDENAARELTKNMDIVELVKVFLISPKLQEKQLLNDLRQNGFR